MSIIQPNTQSRPHRGTFAEGQAHPESYAGEDHVGTFAEGEAHASWALMSRTARAVPSTLPLTFERPPDRAL